MATNIWKGKKPKQAKTKMSKQTKWEKYSKLKTVMTSLSWFWDWGIYKSKFVIWKL